MACCGARRTKVTTHGYDDVCYFVIVEWIHIVDPDRRRCRVAITRQTPDGWELREVHHDEPLWRMHSDRALRAQKEDALYFPRMPAEKRWLEDWWEPPKSDD